MVSFHRTATCRMPFKVIYIIDTMGLYIPCTISLSLSLSLFSYDLTSLLFQSHLAYSILFESCILPYSSSFFFSCVQMRSTS